MDACKLNILIEIIQVVLIIILINKVILGFIYIFYTIATKLLWNL